MPYFLTSICAKRDSIENPTQRTFGFYESVWDAINAVRNNTGNMQECLYNYLVIEFIDKGIHSPVSHEIWYVWQDSKWTDCYKPEFAIGITNWALG